LTGGISKGVKLEEGGKEKGDHKDGCHTENIRGKKGGAKEGATRTSLLFRKIGGGRTGREEGKIKLPRR